MWRIIYVILFLLLPIPFLIAALCHDEIDFSQPYAIVTLIGAITLVVMLFLSSLFSFWIALALSLLVLPLHYFVRDWIVLLLPVYLLAPSLESAGFLILSMLAFGIVHVKIKHTWIKQSTHALLSSAPTILLAAIIFLIQ